MFLLANPSPMDDGDILLLNRPSDAYIPLVKEGLRMRGKNSIGWREISGFWAGSRH